MKTFVTAVTTAISTVAAMIAAGYCLVATGLIQINGPQIAIQAGPGDKKIEQHYEPKQEVVPPPQVNLPNPQPSVVPSATPVSALNPPPQPAPAAVASAPIPVRREPVRGNYQHAQQEGVVDEESYEEEDCEYVEFTYDPGCRVPNLGEVIESDGRYFEVVSRSGRTVLTVEVEEY